MPKIDQLQTGFTSGELSPLMYGSPENPRYKKGLQSALNYIPTLQGPIIRRPGTKYMTPVKDSSNAPTLIPFTFSETQAYMLEFGQNYIRFYANNGQIVTTGTPYQVAGYITNASGPNSYGGFRFFATRQNSTPGQNEFIPNYNTVAVGIPLELFTPYNVADIPLIRYAQNADTLYLVHPKYPVFKVTRSSQTNWAITQVQFQDGPYLPLNTYSTTGDNASTVLSIIAPNTATGSTTDVQTGPSLTVSAMITDPVGSGQIQVTTSTAHGYASGQYVFISGVVGTTEANNYDIVTSHLTGAFYWQITLVNSTTFLLNGSVFVNAYTSGGTVRPGLFGPGLQAQITQGTALFGVPFGDYFRSIYVIIAGQRVYGTLYGMLNAARATIYYFDRTAIPAPASGSGWGLGVWSANTGFPGCVTFHQNRLCFGGNPARPQEVVLSTSASYENMAVSIPTGGSALQVVDSNAIQETLSSNDVNAIFWIKSTAQGLLAGTYSAEWAITPDAQSGTLTPSTFNAQQTSFYGSSQSDSQLIGNAVMYIQRAKRKIREMVYFFQVGTFRSSDVSELSEHITIPTVTQLAVQKETQPILWALRSDGALISMVYNREDLALSCGLTRHVLGGQSDSAGTAPIVTSIAIIPDPTITFDQLWMVVKRYINGSTVYMIEYMTNIFNDGILQEDAFQGDCGATFYNPITISGISIASTAVVTATAHGLSNGSQIKIVSVSGLYKKTTDINGNVSISNLVNEQTFVVAGVTTNTFQLNDFSGNPISSVGYSAYVSSGFVAKLVTTISGLTWLENETVSILADGAIHPDVVVSNSGTITLAFPAAKVQIGYSFASQGQLLRVEGGAADGTSFGKTRRATRYAMQLHRVGDMSVGLSFTNLLPIDFLKADHMIADNAVALYSGMHRDGLESNYGFDSQLCFQQNSMLPGCIQSITTFIEEQDI